MMNQFKLPEYYDHEIVNDDGKKIGEIRIKPSGILWAKNGSHKWHRVDLATFIEWIEANGTTETVSTS